MTMKLETVIGNLDVNAAQMEHNLNLMGGLAFSGTLLLALTQKNILREQAYEWVQRNAMRVWSEGADFQTLILGDSDITEHLSESAIRQVFDVPDKLKYIDTIFERVFGSS